MQNLKVIRTFVAVPIDKEIRQRISEVQERVKKLTRNVKWVEPDNFHVTLKFLGNVPEDQVPQISAALDEVSSKVPAFALSVKGIGAFPKLERARVVWIGIEEGREELIRLAREVEESLSRLRFEKENKPFKAHITIGRVKEGKPADGLAEGIREIDAGDLGRQNVSSVVLMRSELKPDGPVYSPLSMHGLEGH